MLPHLICKVYSVLQCIPAARQQLNIASRMDVVLMLIRSIAQAPQ